jgi:hypothetical protein
MQGYLKSCCKDALHYSRVSKAQEVHLNRFRTVWCVCACVRAWMYLCAVCFYCALSVCVWCVHVYAQVCISTKADFQTVWEVQFLDPQYRLEMEGLPVQVCVGP